MTRYLLGPNCHNINGIWALQPYCLDPWTLRGSCGPNRKIRQELHRCVRGACNFAQAMAFPHGAVVGFRVWGLGFWVLGSGELSHCSKKV